MRQCRKSSGRCGAIAVSDDVCCPGGVRHGVTHFLFVDVAMMSRGGRRDGYSAGGRSGDVRCPIGDGRHGETHWLGEPEGGALRVPAWKTVMPSLGGSLN